MVSFSMVFAEGNHLCKLACVKGC